MSSTVDPQLKCLDFGLSQLRVSVQHMAASELREIAEGHLRAALGPTAEFRDQQFTAIEAVVSRRGRTLVVQRTGWGKSAVYFIATRMLRDRGSGPTLIISPLLALMRDQIDMASRLGLRAQTINSSNREAWTAVEEDLLKDRVDVLIISPERLHNEDFRVRLLERVARATALFVVDEAHCISDWGHDFRPDYRRIPRVLEFLPPSVPVLCTTATANDRVVADISQQLGDELVLLRGSLDRESLRLHVHRLDSQAARLAWLATWLPTLPGSGVIYCLTIDDTRRVAGWLTSRGISAAAYSGDTKNVGRLEIEAALRENQLKAVVATSALGMGYDKPDLGFVVHFQSPNSPIAYYQQVGRAGRALDQAEAILLIGSEDQEIWDYFTSTAFPPQHDAEAAVRLLEASDHPLRMTEIERALNVRPTRLKSMLKLLEVEGAIMKSDSAWQRSVRPWTFDRDRVERVTQQRIIEQDQMRAYAVTDECRMKFLRERLDDPAAVACGRCDNCVGEKFTAPLAVELVASAADFLRRQPVTIEPRVYWPAGSGSSRISADCRLEPGRALSTLGDGGWGSQVWEYKQGGMPFPDSLIDALAHLVHKWAPDPTPQWLTYVPTLRTDRPFVPDLAKRLGVRLSIPVVGCVSKIRHTQPQKLMENSSQQFSNINGAYLVQPPVPPGPMLLVDDVVDSRWTMTVIGAALREAGSGPVFPVALAKAKG